MTDPMPDNVPLAGHGARGWYGHYSWLDAMVRWLARRIDAVANTVPEPPDLSGYATDADVAGAVAPLVNRPEPTGYWSDLVRAARLGYSHTASVLGDSTSDNLSGTFEWPLLSLKLLSVQYPNVRMEHYQWADGSQSYGAPTVVAAGAAPGGGVVAQDTFSVAGNAVGAAADTKGTWVGSGTFTKAAGVATPAANGALSVLCPSQDSTVTSTIRVTTAGYAAPSRGHRFGNAFTNAALTGFGVHALLVVSAASSTSLLIRKQVAAGLTTISSEALDLGLNNVTDQVATVVTSLSGNTFTVTITVGAKVTTRSVTITDAEKAEMGLYAGVNNSPGNSAAGVVWDDLKVETAVIPTPTIALYNGSVAGKNPDYVTAGRVPALMPVPVDSVFLSFGHNGHLNPGGPPEFAAGYKAAIDLIKAAQPAARFFIGSQNPEFSPRDASLIATHAARQALVPTIARDNGAVYVPIFEAFVDSNVDNGRALIQSDGVHPTNPATIAGNDTMGSSLWARTVIGQVGTTTNTPNAVVRRDVNGWVRGGRFVSEIPGAPAQVSETPRWDYVRDRIAEAVVWAQMGNSPWSIGGAEPFQRPSNQVGLVSDFVTYSCFTAPAANTITKLSVPVEQAGAGLTWFQIGLYRVESNGQLTLVARTANNPTAGQTTGLQSLALDTTGGFPASFTFVPGQRYAFGLRAMGTTPPTMQSWFLYTGGQYAPYIAMQNFLGATTGLPTGTVTPGGTWWNAPYVVGLP